ncbi:hypothetical protein [Geodermatophilus sp. CPCC 206100]|uniref:hypothetical protein n=1 Tax=Geodermatophilus sp. CPCC 206100 TaxID=3020054 RepID=UPI003AFFE455
MPIWTVEVTGGRDERVEAGLLATEAGALVAISEEGVMVRAWAPGHWSTVRHLGGTDGYRLDGARERDDVLIGLPRA